VRRDRVVKTVGKSADFPRGLKGWFITHFIVDLLFAVPLFIAPVFTLELFGWTIVDPFTTRLVAAALFGIGIESFIGRNAGTEGYRGMLNLKIIWSSMAIIGMVWSLLEGISPVAWLIVGIFVLFSAVWWYYRIILVR
jgi:hypothetical protein